MATPNSLDRRLIRTLTLSLVAGSLALPSASALAAAPATTSPSDAAVTQDADPAVARSRSLFEQGLDAYDAEDYAGAAESWSEAHELMAQTPELSAGRRVLGFDLAQAQMRAYAQDHDKSRVTAAEPLLRSFVAWVDRPGHTMDEDEKQDRMRALELLERIEDESATPVSVPVPPPEVFQSATTPTQTPPPVKPKPSGTGLLVGGGLALGGGVASVVAGFAATASGRDAERRYDAAQEDLVSSQPGSGAAQAADAKLQKAEQDGRRANIGVITAATSAVLLGAAGVTMLAIGARRRKRHISASAALSPSFAGASVSVRF